MEGGGDGRWRGGGGVERLTWNENLLKSCKIQNIMYPKRKTNKTGEKKSKNSKRKKAAMKINRNEGPEIIK